MKRQATKKPAADKAPVSPVKEMPGKATAPAPKVAKAAKPEPQTFDNDAAGVAIFNAVCAKFPKFYDDVEGDTHHDKIASIIESSGIEQGHHVARHLLGEYLAQCEAAGIIARPVPAAA